MDAILQDLKVMVIDDSNTIRRAADVLLKKTGCTVITAEDGFDALALIVSERPDIIFIDVMMPRLNGYETCSIIRSNPEFDNIPLVLLSSKSSFCDKARGAVVGANSYLTKPFSKSELLDTIGKLISKTEDMQDAVNA
jgi:twitching motility two-component system response regulator PilG